MPPEVVRAIARRELAAVARREGLERHGLTLKPTERLVESLAEVGFDARYGARPLQRTLEKLVVTPLARLRLGKPGLRDAAIEMDWLGIKTVFRL